MENAEVNMFFIFVLLEVLIKVSILEMSGSSTMKLKRLGISSCMLNSCVSQDVSLVLCG